MNAGRIAVIAAVLAAVLVIDVPKATASVGQCVEYDSQGFCVEWDVATPGGPGSSRGVRGSTERPTCYWVTVQDDLSQDPTIWIDFGLTPPPEGAEVVWQSWECTDGSPAFNFRWVLAATPENLASVARGRLVGVLPQPAVRSSPAVGTASIVDVPVFVEVTNWTGTTSASECAGGLCVTVTASPSLSFSPGEPGSSPLACAGSGTRYDPEGPPPEEQAAAPGACAYAYRLRTGAEGRPGAWPGSVSVTWTLAWSASSGASGALPAVTRSSSLPRAVEEVQTVVVGGQSP